MIKNKELIKILQSFDNNSEIIVCDRTGYIQTLFLESIIQDDGKIILFVGPNKFERNND